MGKIRIIPIKPFKSQTIIPRKCIILIIIRIKNNKSGSFTLNPGGGNSLKDNLYQSNLISEVNKLIEDEIKALDREEQNLNLVKQGNKELIQYLKMHDYDQEYKLILSDNIFNSDY